MAHDTICTIKGDICSIRDINTRNELTTEVQVTVDEFGNLEIIDPQNQLGPVYSENVGNLGGTGSQVNLFALDSFGNFKFMP